MARVTHGLHVDVHEGNGPHALVVHGLMAGRALWSANVDALCTVCTPVVVELYGHGRSTTPEDPAAYEPRSYAAAFEAIRAELGAERWFVIGHSLGAGLVLRYASDHRERVIAQVLTNSASALASDRWRRRIQETAPDEAARLEAAGREGLVEHRINPARSRHIVEHVRRRLADDQHLLDPVAIGRAIVHTTPGTSMRERIMVNRIPTLLVAGERETAFAEGRDHAAQAPNVEVRRVDAGHSPNAEIPEVFNAAVIEFLRRHRPADRPPDRASARPQP